MNGIATIATIVFWLCLAGVLYTYVLYPALIWALARVFGREPDYDVDLAGGEPPFISVLIAAHNEEAVIAERIVNALALDYPASRIEIVIASDGSTDRTTEVVRRLADPRMKLIEFSTRRGKASVLNAVVPTLAGEIVILSDANTTFEPSVARRFAAWFRDPSVGVVVGRLILIDPVAGRNVDSLYWRYETFLKRCEGRLGALLGANGGVYAIRRSLFAPLRADTLVDDFVLPLQMRLATGCDIVYDTSIVASEETPPGIGDEFRRRSRIGAGGFQSIGVLWPLLSPLRGWIALSFASHKVLRWCVPFLLLGALASNLVLLKHGWYQASLSAQGLFYGAAVAGSMTTGSGLAARFLRLISLFTGMNIALLAGFGRWALGVKSGTWQRTRRDTTVKVDLKGQDHGAAV